MSSRLRNIYACMKTRCYNENAVSYQHYGARGITICTEWRESFTAFESWALANGYGDTLTLDRLDNDGPYSPENCRWVTWKEQARNRRGNNFISFDGEIKTATEHAEQYGIPRQTFYRRLQRGWDVQKALTTPVRSYAGRGENVV